MESEEKKDERRRAQASTFAFFSLVIFNLLPHPFWQGRVLGSAILLFTLMPGWFHMAALIFLMQRRYKLMTFCASNAVFMTRMLNLIPNNPLALGLPNYMQTEISGLLFLEETQDAIRECYSLIGLLEKVKPTYHLSIAKAKVLLGTALSMEGEYAKSESVMNEAMQEMEANGADPRQLAAMLADMAATHSKMGHIEAAIKASKRAIQLQEQLLATGSNEWMKKQDRITLGMILNNTATCFEEAGDEQEALKLHQRSLEIKLEAFGEKSREAAIAYTNLGYTNLCVGNTERGAELCSKAKEIGNELNLARENHRMWSAILCNSGNALHSTGKLVDAEKDLVESLKIREKWNSPQRHETLLELGKLYRDVAKYDQAKECLQQAIKIRESLYGIEHPLVGRALREYLKLSKKLGAENEISEIETRIEKIKTKGNKPS